MFSIDLSILVWRTDSTTINWEIISVYVCGSWSFTLKYSEIKKKMKDFGTSLLLVYASLEHSSFNYKIQETSSLPFKKMRKGIYHQSEQWHQGFCLLWQVFPWPLNLHQTFQSQSHPWLESNPLGLFQNPV